MALRKGQPVAEPLVRIAEVLAEVGGGGNPNSWQAEAEELADGMRAAVVRDWRGHPCLTWTDGERLLLRLRRDREQAGREQAEALASQGRGRYVGVGVVGLEAPDEGDWRGPSVKVRELL